MPINVLNMNFPGKNKFEWFCVSENSENWLFQNRLPELMSCMARIKG